MISFKEGGIRIDFPKGLNVRKFDACDTHGRLDRGMKAVDFIVELSDKFLFIEVKEPRDLIEENVRKKEHRRAMKGVVRKFRDSFIYEWARGRADNKPIVYIVLVGLDQVSSGALTNHADNLRWWLPERGPFDNAWERPLVAACAVMDLANWNCHELTKKFPAVRVS